MYVKTENSVVVEYPYSYQKLIADNSNTSFPESMPDNQLDSWGIFPVNETAQPIPNAGEIVEEVTPSEINGVWTQQWNVRPATQEETDNQANEVRSQRNRLLYECDWTQLSDAPVDSLAWANYRQALRDVTSQPGFPWSVVWPSQP